MTKQEQIFEYMDELRKDEAISQKQYPELTSEKFGLKITSTKVFLSRWRSKRGLAKKYRSRNGSLVSDALTKSMEGYEPQ